MSGKAGSLHFAKKSDWRGAFGASQGTTADTTYTGCRVPTTWERRHRWLREHRDPLGDFGRVPRVPDGMSESNSILPGQSATPTFGTPQVVLARVARNRRLADALYQWAFTALTSSPGACAYYDPRRAAGVTHHAALRAVANRLVGLRHGCLRHQTPYDETIAWHLGTASHTQSNEDAAAA